MADPISWAFAGASAISAGSQILGGMSQKSSQNEQAKIAVEQAGHERARAAIQADEYRRRESLAAARGRAIRGASGVDPNSGTPLAIDAESAKEGEFGAQQLLHEGALRAYRLEQEASTRKRAGHGALIGAFINAGTTALTSALGPNQKGWGAGTTPSAQQLTGVGSKVPSAMRGY